MKEIDRTLVDMEKKSPLKSFLKFGKSKPLKIAVKYNPSSENKTEQVELLFLQFFQTRT